MIVIDGAQGEGGGQVFRTSLTLSMQSGQPVRIKNIRAGRSKPGLLRQHLACLRAASEICSADVQGAELGSDSVTFRPGKVEAGDYHFSIGSAGSTSLVFQTVFLPLMFVEKESHIRLEGGTHNGHAPSFDFIAASFLPVLETMGFRAHAKLDRYGFYPAGDGAWSVKVGAMCGVQALSLTERGEIVSQRAVATSSRIPEHITERELAQVQKKFNWSGEQLEQNIVESAGPGNIVSLRIKSEQVTEVVDMVGEKQLSAERVADRAIKAVKRYLESGVPVGEYLADQLLLPMVLGGGGQFRTVSPSLHLKTNVEIIRQFMGVDIRVEQEDEHAWRVVI